MEQTFFDWKYCYDKGVYNIIPDRKIERPNTFFKYYALNDYSVDALIHTYIYASHPNQLNDTIDCSEMLLEFDDIEYIRPTLEGHPYFANLKDDELLTVENKAFAQKAFTTLIYQKLGILSLSSTPHNDLLWAYYTNNHGFCIEFDVSLFEFKHHGPFPINYQHNLYPIPTSTIKDSHLAILMQSNVKKTMWEREQEWRLLVEAPGNIDLTSFGCAEYAKLGGYDRRFPYPIHAIKSITLGMSFFDFDERISSSQEICKDFQCRFKLSNSSSKNLKQAILDFVCYHHIRIDYTAVNSLSEIIFFPMNIEKSNEPDSDYIGTIL